MVFCLGVGLFVGFGIVVIIKDNKYFIKRGKYKSGEIGINEFELL